MPAILSSRNQEQTSPTILRFEKVILKRPSKNVLHIIEKKFRIPHVQHVPIEPHIAVAQVEPDGDVTVWASSQSPFSQRSSFAKALGSLREQNPSDRRLCRWRLSVAKPA